MTANPRDRASQPLAATMSPASDHQRTGLMFLGAPRVPEMVRYARLAEQRGFESVWVAETRLTRDAFVPMAAIAEATEHIKIGSGIVNVYTRNPVLLAISFAALHELAPGRIIIGLGAGAKAVLEPQGIAFDRPLTRMREYLHVLPQLLQGETVTFHGETVTVDGARLDDEMTAGSGAALSDRLPIYMGVTGPRALELTGQVADGVMLNALLPTSYVAHARERMAAGAKRSGRDPREIDITMAVVVSPDEDSRVGKDRARRFAALYISMFPKLASGTGLEESFMAEIRASFDADGLEAAAAVIPDAVVDTLCAAGTPEECRKRLDEYRAAGVAVPILAPLEPSTQFAIETLI
ncbi:MAG: class flavin-dependent oxidoreductase [Solirubrobacterales bacterium]|nr:class flavin-dependent oxidoreductase [Solirubrobacterales bacterium]